MGERPRAKAQLNDIVSGLKWSYAGTVISVAGQTLYTLSIARLLGPAEFGLFGMASVALRFVTYFSQMGLESALVQRRTLEKRDAGSALAFALAVSLAGAFSIAILAPVVGMFFRHSEVVAILRVLAVSVVFNAVGGIGQGLLRRHLMFRSAAIVDSASYLIAYCGVGLGLAWHGAGVWSLASAALLQSLISSGASLFLARKHLSLTSRLRPALQLARYGGTLSAISFVEFIAYGSDAFLIGRMFGASPLGTYNRAAAILAIPTQYLMSGLQKVFFPVISSMAEAETGRQQGISLTAIFVAASVTLPCSLGASAGASTLVAAVLGGKWHAVVPLITPLALTLTPNFTGVIHGAVLDAAAAFRLRAGVQLAFVAVLALLYSVMTRFGIVGVAWAVMAASWCRWGLMQWAYCTISGVPLKATLSQYRFAIVSSGSVYAAILAVNAVLQGRLAVGLMLGCDLIIGATTCVALAWLFPPAGARDALVALTAEGSIQGATPKWLTYLASHAPAKEKGSE